LESPTHFIRACALRGRTIRYENGEDSNWENCTGQPSKKSPKRYLQLKVEITKSGEVRAGNIRKGCVDLGSLKEAGNEELQLLTPRRR